MEKIRFTASQKKLLLLLRDNVHEGFNKYMEDDKLKEAAFELQQMGLIDVIYNAQKKPIYITLNQYGQAYFIFNPKLINPHRKLTNNIKWIIGILITILFGILTLITSIN